MQDITGRQDFDDTWLFEQPQGLGTFETWDTLEYIIKDRITTGSQVIKLPNNLNKIQVNQTLLYWFGDNANIILATELHKAPQALVVSVTGKNPRYTGKPPYASTLYHAILKDQHQSLRVLSDKTLSDEGYSIWKRLVNLGHSVSVYDTLNPGKTFHTFTSSSELDQFFSKDDTEYKRYQFVLSESGEVLAETRNMFSIRRYRESIPGLL
jgi:hypothetical protein